MPVKMLGRPPFRFYGRYTTKKKIPAENEATQRRFLLEPGDDIDFTGPVTEECVYSGVSSFCHASSC